MRIAMWSGPRNLSTAMMYSFGARSDCAVWDEPFYAAYLAATGLTHPMRADVLAEGGHDPVKVAKRCLGEVPDGKPVFYQKMMTHHMLPEFDRSWLNEMTNVFLIRHPAKVMASYLAKREVATLDDIGFVQQEELFRLVHEAGKTPVVIDSDDILEAPEAALSALCAAVDLPFQYSMLNWPAGGHKDDGAWAPHWYESVWKSTGFKPTKPSEPVSDGLDPNILARALVSYDYLRQYRIKPQNP